MLKLSFQEVDFRLQYFLMAHLKEEIKYLQMLEQLKCMESKENIYSDCNNPLCMALINSILILVLIWFKGINLDFFQHHMNMKLLIMLLFNLTTMLQDLLQLHQNCNIIIGELVCLLLQNIME
jgi:hypothetical protein